MFVIFLIPFSSQNDITVHSRVLFSRSVHEMRKPMWTAANLFLILLHLCAGG